MKKVLLVLAVSFFFISNVNAQKGKMAAGGQIGISLPLGDFGDGANMGFGFLGNYFYGVTPDIDLTGTIGYYTWGSEFDGISFSDVPLLFGGRYYFQRQAFSPYGLAELGMHFMSYDAPEVHYLGQTYGGGGSDTEFGLNFGGGFLYNLGNMMLDVNAKFNIISDANHITLMAGLKFPLG